MRKRSATQDDGGKVRGIVDAQDSPGPGARSPVRAVLMKRHAEQRGRPVEAVVNAKVLFPRGFGVGFG